MDNGILSQWTPPYMPQHNGMAERRNQTLLDMVRSMMGKAYLGLCTGDCCLYPK